MNQSRLSETVEHVCTRSASALVARGRLASPGLNAALLRRLSSTPGSADSFLSEPAFEAATAWESAQRSLGELSGDLLHPDLIDALDGASSERMPRDRHPYTHQLEAWRAARDGFSYIVTSGTGSGKTECFMVPILDDLLRDPARGRLSGVRAIVIYPLNALIESQRTRLAAWTETLKHRVSFALYNGLTPETKRQIKRTPSAAELGDRRTIRENPPAILITNVTMLEYLLLRAKDLPILERSHGCLRWIVLDEAHGYIGAQAAEMALLLRRVRGAFGVKPEQVRLVATSATISEGGKEETREKLGHFVADLAGVGDDRVRVIEGRETEPVLPQVGPDTPLNAASLASLSPPDIWNRLAPHPRLQGLKREMKSGGLRLTKIAEILFDDPNAKDRAQAILDLAARAADPDSSHAPSSAKLLPWRAHLFQRGQGGIWACVDPSCPHRDPELTGPAAEWGFGAVWLSQRDHCECEAPVFEVVACTECGTPYLIAGRKAGVTERLIPHRSVQLDEFVIDEEPDPEQGEAQAARDSVWLRPAQGNFLDRLLNRGDGTLYDNEAPGDARVISISVIEEVQARACCANAARARLQPQRYSAPFFMGTILPELLERLAQPLPKSGLPMGGRRALTFSDSRQGTARLAAKLQQDAERTLTRAFLYHAVQEGEQLTEEERRRLEKKRELFQSDPEEYAHEIAEIERQLSGEKKAIPWNDLINRFAFQSELQDFATEVWAERRWGGREMAENPTKLAEMFLYRELFRRPRVQNNAETMGLVRLVFPELEAKARAAVPSVLKDAGVGAEAWAGLAQAALDSIFRNSLAIHITEDWMVRWINPRWGRLQSIVPPGLAPQDQPANSRVWPAPKLHPGNPSRLVRLIYWLIGGDSDSTVDQDRAQDVLDALWTLITSTAAKDVGRGTWRLDFRKAAIERLEHGWLCPITRRVLGYTTGGPSPYGPKDERLLTPLSFPRLPHANAGGLDWEKQQFVAGWCENDPTVRELRKCGLWTDLQDRVAIYPPFLRAQEHSAQIERPVLEIYEERFKEGKINLLNCSTTMEMGVDIPNVTLVANANVPPSLSNYRQRVGRAGRRGEPWAFAMTFCRDLPLDHVVFQDPLRFLASPIAAPKVRLDSEQIVRRHVHAALLAGFLRTYSGGVNIKTSTGAFFGATDDPAAPVADENLANDFLLNLTKPAFAEAQRSYMHRLTHATVLERNDPVELCSETADAFEGLLQRWRGEYEQLLHRAAAAADREIRQAFEMRAKRMHGEFLLSELARRGFTPSYGFPVDVIGFDHLSGHKDEASGEGSIAFGYYRGGASRTLDVAIREYAPGAEVVIDGLVHRSEGVRPAWSAMADESGLEDLQVFWECRSCHRFGLSRDDQPAACPQCSAPKPRWNRTLRPAGFLGRRAPHTGYENLGHVPFEMPRISAAHAPWQALPDPAVGRIRADRQGQVITQSSGRQGKGFALCLCCGRAEAEADEPGGPLPDGLKKHTPLAPSRKEELVKGSCPGGLTRPERILRNVRFAHEGRTDVFEFQLPEGATRAQALAFAAGLREALAERLGAEANEVGLAVGKSLGVAREARISAFLFDRAAGGAGLSVRLAELDWLKDCLDRAADRWLDCPEECEHGCPACVLRPDLNFGDEFPDRPGGLELVQRVARRLNLPSELRVFGSETSLLGSSLPDWLRRQQLTGKLQALTVYLHGDPREWELADWPMADLLEPLTKGGITITLVFSSAALTDKGLEIAQKLDLYRLAARARLVQGAALPEAGEKPVLAIAEVDGKWIAIAGENADATPGPAWGNGQQIPLLSGPVSTKEDGQEISAERLVTLSAGNARLVWLGNDLDGPAAGFGSRFWKALGAADPLSIAVLKEHGVNRITYTDRYFLTPLNFRLLYEVLAALPGKSAKSKIEIRTAQINRPVKPGWAMFHPFFEDRLRHKVLTALFRDAAIEIAPKTQQPHARSLTLELGDGRYVRILLDQGFGAWRASGPPPRHDFRAPQSKQAEALKRADAQIRIALPSRTPMILEFP